MASPTLIIVDRYKQHPNIGIDTGRVEAVGEMPNTLNYTMAKVVLLKE